MKTLTTLLTAAAATAVLSLDAGAQAPTAPPLPTLAGPSLPPQLAQNDLRPMLEIGPASDPRPTLLPTPAAPSATAMPQPTLASEPTLPPALPPSYETPSYPSPVYPQPSSPQPIYPSPAYPQPTQPDHRVGPNHVPPAPIDPSYGLGPHGHGSFYGPPAVAPLPPQGRYVSPPSLVVQGPLRPYRVRYKDRDNVHPFSIRQTLVVPSPCGQGTLAVDVCAPPNCPVVKVKRNGKKIEYDYGDYEVDIIRKDDEILVDYDD